MKKTKEQLEKDKKILEKKIEKINAKIKEMERPQPIGFIYKNKT